VRWGRGLRWCCGNHAASVGGALWQVADCPKQRFQMTTEDGVDLIRASQGHSIKGIADDELLTLIEVRGLCCPRCWLLVAHRRQRHGEVLALADSVAPRSLLCWWCP
jgi:hypothetical protein